jgi:hypothetical protein
VVVREKTVRAFAPFFISVIITAAAAYVFVNVNHIRIQVADFVDFHAGQRSVLELRWQAVS